MSTKILSDAHIADVLAKTAGTVMVKVSADWCPPCRLSAPVMHKLALEFAGRMTLVEIDGDIALEFLKAHEVRSIPEVLVFVDGKLTGRVSGYPGAEKLREAVAGHLGVSVAGEASAAELSFRAACASAAAALDRAMEPFLKVVRAIYAEIDPEIEPIEAGIEAEVAAGRLSKAEAKKRIEAEYERLEAPFQDKYEAVEKIKDEALVAYDASMGEAIAAFGRGAAQAAPAPVSDVAGMVCRPGDRVCSLGQAAAE